MIISEDILSIEEIKQRITPICTKYGIKRAAIFGSYARGEATKASDVDFHIDVGNIKSLFTLSAFRNELSETLDKEIDIIPAEPEKLIFKKALEKDEVEIYAV